jgi:hypothetical protein
VASTRGISLRLREGEELEGFGIHAESFPAGAGIAARPLEAADDPEALRAEIVERLNAVRSPFRTAERFGVEEIIDPRDTRPLLCDWAQRAHELVAMEVAGGPKARGLRP